MLDKLLKLRDMFRDRFGGKQTRLDVIDGLMGDRDGNVAVSGRNGYVYVRLPDSSVVQAFNNRVARVSGMPVLVGYDAAQPELLQVLSLHVTSEIIAASADVTSMMVPHAHTHEWLNTSGGNDPVFVQLRQFMELRVTPDTLNVVVHRGLVPTSGGYAGLAQTTVDLSSSVPTSGSRIVLIYVDSAGALQTLDGDTAASVGFADIPQSPAGSLDLAAVKLAAGQTSISEDATTMDIFDLRFAGVARYISTLFLQQALILDHHRDVEFSHHVVGSL